MLKTLLAGVTILITVVTLAAPAAAQSNAGIVGVIADTSGAVLPGVTVTAKGPALQVPLIVAVSDTKGEYRLSPLPPGTYTVTFELPGFQTVKRENVRLALGFTATLDQALGLGTVQETITVSGASPLVDVTNPATAVDMSAESLEILPTNRDGLKAFMGTMPGVRTNLDVGASSLSDTVQFRSFGQAGQSWQMLEGIMFSTPNAGGANGSHVDFNALDSTRVQTVGSAAEMPRRGIMLDAVMKSGGNQFHGDAIYYGSSGALKVPISPPSSRPKACEMSRACYEYPVSLNGLAFAGTTIVPVVGKQTFKTIEVAGTRRISKGWQAAASITATKANVPFVDEQADNPNTEIFAINNTWETTSKVSGGYTLPFEVIVSATYERRSGTPQAPAAQFSGGQTINNIVLNIDPIGTINLPSTNLWNMRFAKRIHLKTGQSLEGRFDFFNIFNTNFVTSRSVRVGPSYLVPSATILPRILQMGVTYTF